MLLRDLVEGAAVVLGQPIALVEEPAHARHEPLETSGLVEAVEGGRQGRQVDGSRPALMVGQPERFQHIPQLRRVIEPVVVSITHQRELIKGQADGEGGLGETETLPRCVQPAGIAAGTIRCLHDRMNVRSPA